jgi:hypothetical protein
MALVRSDCSGSAAAGFTVSGIGGRCVDSDAESRVTIEGRCLISGCALEFDAWPSFVDPTDSASGDEDFCCSSFSRCSSPLTRFRSASRTSVFGPRFFGTASDNHS